MMWPWRQLDDRRGFALLMVIIILLLVSLLASQLILEVRTELRTATNSRSLAHGGLLAEGGVNIALFRLLDKPELGTSPPEFGEVAGIAGSQEVGFFLGRKYETVLPAGKIEYYALDEAGKINLNSTATGLMDMFLEYQGLSPEEIAVVLDSLADWRDSDNLTRLNGAELDYYKTLLPPYTPRNGNFEDPAEFFLIKGTESLRGRFDPYEVFTVHNPGNNLNFNSLSVPLVEFLCEGDQAKITQYQKEKEETETFTAAQAQELLGPERYARLQLYLGFTKPSRSICSIVARGWAGRGEAPASAEDTEGKPAPTRSGTMVRVLVKLNPGKDGFKYLSWREGDL